MVVDDTGRFLTQRTLPRMSLVSVAIEGSALLLNAPDMDILEVPLRPEQGQPLGILGLWTDLIGTPDSHGPVAAARGQPRLVEVWGDRCQALSLGDAPSRWFTEFLGVPSSLVYMPDATVRKTDPSYGPGRVG